MMRTCHTCRAAAAVALSLLGSCLGCGGGNPPAGLVLVTIDTCRADRIGCYGAGGDPTPAIDGIARRGVVFADVSAPAPLTLPSHCSILTGLYPDRHTVRDNGAGRLPEEAETLAEILRREGWRTGAFVSAVPLESGFGARQGFDTYDDAFSETAAGAVARAPGNPDAEDVAGRLFYDERIAAETVEAALPWLRDAMAGPDPFFLWIHFFDPHAVYRPPPPYAFRYGPDSYEGEIAYVDEQVGRLLETLAPLGDRVTVAVTADHGESLGEHEEQTHGLFVYQSSLRVPWVLAGPGVPRGQRVDRPISLVHVLPTVLDAIGVAVPPGLDAESALPPSPSSPADEEALHGECLFARFHYDWSGLRFVRKGRWKLIEAPRPELYDLREDPHETTNVAALHPEVVAELRQVMRDHAARGGRLDEVASGVDEGVRERLERLGYVGGGEAASGDVRDDLWNLSGRDPKDMVGFFNRLQEVPTLMITGANDEAERTLAELRELDPRNRNVLEKLALLRRLEEQWEEARDLCEEILRLDPADHQTRKNLAFALVRLGDREAARRAYREVTKADPGDADAWGLLGSLCSEDGLHAEAIRVLTRAVELAPSDAEILASLARAWEDSGDVDEALAAYDRALEADAGLSAAVNGKALLLSHTGRPREAVEVLRRGLPRLEDDLETLNNLAWILTNESIDPGEGFRLARHAAELAPSDPAVLDTFGWAAIRSGHPAEGVAALREAWETTGDDEVRAHLGVALAESGSEAEGRAHLRAAVAARPALERVAEIAKWLR